MNPTLEYLYSLQTFGMKFGLRNIRALLRYCGNPHRQFRTIHIAGTNGKGSTSSMTAAILTAAGYKAGLYTSPHLVSFNERIRINGVMIPDRELVRYVRTLRPEIDRLKATFFEAATAVAFRYFADHHVDVAVIETGLGGRLDSTNVLKPMVSVITSIGKDHTQILGSSLRAIAMEKAGIIKPHVPLVIGSLRGTARTAILTAAKIKRSVCIDAVKLNIPPGLKIDLKGTFQQVNAQCAVAAVSMISSRFLIGDNAVKRGLEQTTALSGLRARFEFHKGKPNLLLDVAHNPDGIASLVSEVKRLGYKKIAVLFGVMKDKDHRTMLKHLKLLRPEIIATQPHGDRALPFRQIRDECKLLGIRSEGSKNIQEALRDAKRSAGPHGLLLVTGSHYLVGEVIPLIEKKS